MEDRRKREGEGEEHSLYSAHGGGGEGEKILSRGHYPPEEKDQKRAKKTEKREKKTHVVVAARNMTGRGITPTRRSNSSHAQFPLINLGKVCANVLY